MEDASHEVSLYNNKQIILKSSLKNTDQSSLSNNQIIRFNNFESQAKLLLASLNIFTSVEDTSEKKADKKLYLKTDKDFFHNKGSNDDEKVPWTSFNLPEGWSRIYDRANLIVKW